MSQKDRSALTTTLADSAQSAAVPHHLTLAVELTCGSMLVFLSINRYRNLPQVEPLAFAWGKFTDNPSERVKTALR